MKRTHLLTSIVICLTLWTSAVAQQDVLRNSTADNLPLISPKSGDFDCDIADFTGTKRRACKISIGSGDTVDYKSLDDLLADLPKSDKEMQKMHIPDGKESERTEFEVGNVRVKAFLYVCKREHGDNDYHIILSNSPSKSPYMNAECSGFPTDEDDKSSLKVLTKVRKQFEDFMEGTYCSEKWKDLDGTPVQITGSLFYDVDHKPGVVGPQGHRPTTSWEIHPITNIKFLDK